MAFSNFYDFNLPWRSIFNALITCFFTVSELIVNSSATSRYFFPSM